MRNAALILLLALGACKREAPVRVSRYEAVKPAAPAGNSWCDQTYPAHAPALTLPPVTTTASGGAAPPLSKGKATWVNLWATWCGPCLREMPLLLAWQKDLKKDGVDLELLLVSVDEDAATLSAYLAEHTEIPSSRVRRAASPAEYDRWIRTYAKEPSAAIPIHLLAGAEGTLRCLRVGSLREGDYPIARGILR
jgi:thiol-disulfide isomerase/thioredoxin